MKISAKPLAIPDKRETTRALWMIGPFIAVVAIWRTFVYFVYVPAFQLANDLLSLGQTINIYDLLAYFLAYSAVVLLLIGAMKRSGQSLGSIGITRENLGRMFTLGVLLGGVYLLLSGAVSSLFLGQKFVGLSVSLLYGLILFAMVGFAEEVIWRGYTQTRLVARIGKLKGLVVTSLMFAFLWHFPAAFYTQSSEDILGALAYASLRIFSGFLFGYIMTKSQNIIPSSILHFLYDWGSILWK